MTWSELVALAGLTSTAGALNLRPRYNVAPTQDVAVVRAGPGGGREAVLMRWGLVPSWAKDPAIGSRMINARAETVAEKPSFRRALAARRCLIPATGFYEWRKATGKGAKQPFWIGLEGEVPFTFAGLWERWQGADDGVRVETCTIITTEANAALAPVHHRMPVILDASAHAAWLDVDGTDTAAAVGLLVPSAAAMALHPVSRHVNNVRNDDAGCMAPSSVDDETGTLL